jgi:hypothetical protein
MAFSLPITLSICLERTPMDFNEWSCLGVQPAYCLSRYTLDTNTHANYSSQKLNYHDSPICHSQSCLSLFSTGWDWFSTAMICASSVHTLHKLLCLATQSVIFPIRVNIFDTGLYIFSILSTSLLGNNLPHKCLSLKMGMEIKKYYPIKWQFTKNNWTWKKQKH